MHQISSEERNNFLIVISAFIITELLIRFLYPFTGGQAGALCLIPSMIIAWFWGPWFGITGAFVITVISLINLNLISTETIKASDDILGISVTLIITYATGYIGNIQKKNQRLTEETQKQKDELEAALTEKINTENALLEKIEFIRFSTRISSEFINIPSLLIESRIETALGNIFKFLEADSCSVYIYDEVENTYVLFKELYKKDTGTNYRHIYRIKAAIFNDLYDTLITEPYLEMNKLIWNHPLLDIFNSPSLILLPLMSNDKLIGVISFESLSKEKDWSKYYQDIFPLTEQIIAYAFERKFAEEKIRSQYDELKSNSESLQEVNIKLKKLNETLLKTSEDLAESEMKFREMSENLEDIVWLQSGKKVLYVNSAYEKVWGRNREDLYSRSLDFLYAIYGEDRADVINSFFNHNYLKEGDFQKEFRIRDTKGNIKWILARAALIKVENGKIKVAGIAEDITLRKQAEVEIKNALDKAMELNQLKSRFISTVSHELRTPLATILSSIELLRTYESSMNTKEKSSHYEKIVESIDFLTSMLDDVMTMDKSESGYVKLNPENVEVVSEINEIIQKVGLIKNVKTSINFVPEIEKLEVVTDKKLFFQIITNLVTNAVKFSPSNKNIEIFLKPCGKDFEIRIADKGMGIPDDAKPNIFVPFFRAQNAQFVQGTGLGLSIVKRWTELLNGSISFESTLNKGTVFILKFPVQY